MDILTKIFSILTLTIGVFVLFAVTQRNFDHRGMLLAGIIYFIGGALGLYLKSFFPPLFGVMGAVGIRKFLGEPDYSQSEVKNKNPFQLWGQTYKPLVGPTGEPANYITVMERITDMTPKEKADYISKKIENNLLWTVVDKGDGKLVVRPGRHEGNVIAWWICDIPYPDNAIELTILK